MLAFGGEGQAGSAQAGGRAPRLAPDVRAGGRTADWAAAAAIALRQLVEDEVEVVLGGHGQQVEGQEDIGRGGEGQPSAGGGGQAAGAAGRVLGSGSCQGHGFGMPGGQLAQRDGMGAVLGGQGGP